MRYLVRPHAALGTAPFLLRQGQLPAVLDQTHGASPSASIRASAAPPQWTMSPAPFCSQPAALLGNAVAMLLSLLLPLHTLLQVTVGGFCSPFSHKSKCSIYPKAINGCFHSAHNPLSSLSQAIGCVEFKVTKYTNSGYIKTGYTLHVFKEPPRTLR